MPFQSYEAPGFGYGPQKVGLLQLSACQSNVVSSSSTTVSSEHCSSTHSVYVAM